jgi:adenylyltransferase/sulfurtransferase
MTPAQRDRYARHIRLPQIGESGQQAILDASALIVGVGGLGSPAAMYLAAAGIGKLILSDFDIVETSNLQRQIIHNQGSVGENKVDSGRQTLAALNPDCEVEVIGYQLEGDELRQVINSVDIVLDCSDNYPTRFEVNRCCVETATPLVTGASIRLEGQIMNYQPAADSACYQCLYTEAYGNEESCELEGVLGPVASRVTAGRASRILRQGDTLPLHRQRIEQQQAINQLFTEPGQQ